MTTISVISKHFSRHSQFLLWLASSQLHVFEVFLAHTEEQATVYFPFLFQVWTSQPQCFFLSSFLSSVRIKQFTVWERNERGDSSCFLLRFCDKAAYCCCIHKQAVKANCTDIMSRLCLPSLEQSFWSVLGFNRSHSFQDKFPIPASLQ